MNHGHCANSLSAGVKALPDRVQAFSHTQAMWLSNPRVNPREPAQPSREAARDAVGRQDGEWVLCIHDGSRLNSRKHEAKQDRLRMTHEQDVGCELQGSLLVGAHDGAPLAVAAQNRVTAGGVWRCREKDIDPDGQKRHLDELSERMNRLEQPPWGKRRVRVKTVSPVCFEGQSMGVVEVAERLTFHETRRLQCKGRLAVQWIASAPVALTRKAKPKREAPDGKRMAPIPGAPTALRLGVSRLRDTRGRVLAEGYWLGTLPDTVSDAQSAQEYDFRRPIESFFKRLKQAGHPLERREQESGGAIFKRLPIATHACLPVWRLARERGEAARPTQDFLARLSGRQMKVSRPVAMPALLNGLFMLFALLETLEHYPLEQLRAFARSVLHEQQHHRGKEYSV
jgi:hypothetical protein